MLQKRNESIFILTKSVKFFPKILQGQFEFEEKRKNIPHKYPRKVVTLTKKLLSIARRVEKPKNMLKKRHKEYRDFDKTLNYAQNRFVNIAI